LGLRLQQFNRLSPEVRLLLAVFFSEERDRHRGRGPWFQRRHGYLARAQAPSRRPILEFRRRQTGATGVFVRLPRRRRVVRSSPPLDDPDGQLEGVAFAGAWPHRLDVKDLWIILILDELEFVLEIPSRPHPSPPVRAVTGSSRYTNAPNCDRIFPAVTTLPF